MSQISNIPMGLPTVESWARVARATKLIENGSKDMPSRRRVLGNDGVQFIHAQITGYSAGFYSWKQREFTGAGTFADVSGGLTGTNDLYEINGRSHIINGTQVIIWSSVDTGGAERLWFDQPQALFYVKVEAKSGGSLGSESTVCTKVYDVRTTDWNGTSGGVLLGSSLAPLKPRPKGLMKVQTGSTGIGVGGWIGTTFYLWDAGEVEDTATECPS